MTIYHPLLSVAQVREMERAVIAAETEPDQTMRKAASAVVKTAHWMAGIPELGISEAPSVLLLVGSGANGGDGLYAAAGLVEAGWAVTVALVAEKVHERGLAAVQGTSARVIGFENASPERIADAVRSADLVIDAILGIGGHGRLRAPAAQWVETIQATNTPILSVDTPSGVDVDTGYAHGVTVRATASVTFGTFRRVHGFSAQSGVVVLADCGLGEAARKLVAHDPEEIEWGTRVVGPDALKDLPDGLIGFGAQPAETVWWSPARWPQEAAEPDPSADKYSGGVAGLCTGSEQYPGAAVLSTGGAVKTTSSMVRYAGQCSGLVLQSYPEVVASPSIAETGRVQSWVVGSGQDPTLAYKNLHHLVGTDQPLVVDAGALTALAEDISSGGSLLSRIRLRTAVTLLTPHAGEFAYIARALAEAKGVEIPDPTADPLAAAQGLAEYLDVIVLLKGRTTILSEGTHTLVVDAGCSWAATPGSGDVLVGILGALLAEKTPVEDTLMHIAEGVRTHALAAELSARLTIPGTDRFGYSSTSASRIVDTIPAARALEATRPRDSECWNDAS